MNDILELAHEKLEEIRNDVPEREYLIALSAAAIMTSLHPDLKHESAQALGYLLSQIDCDVNVTQNTMLRIAMLQHAVDQMPDIEEILK